MRSVAVVLALVASGATAFVHTNGLRAASAPRTVRKAASISMDDDSVASSVKIYDPTAGSEPPMTRNNNEQLWLPQRARPRRNRKSAAMRAMVRENFVLPCHFIYPLFIHEDSDETIPIPSMPGQSRHTLDSMMKEVAEAWEYGVRSFVLFPKVPDALKTNYADECYNPNGSVAPPPSRYQRYHHYFL